MISYHLKDFYPTAFWLFWFNFKSDYEGTGTFDIDISIKG